MDSRSHFWTAHLLCHGDKSQRYTVLQKQSIVLRLCLMLIFIRDCSFRSPLALLCFSHSYPQTSLFPIYFWEPPRVPPCVCKALPIVICYCGFRGPDKLREILLWATTIFPLMLPGDPKTWRASDVLLIPPTIRHYLSSSQHWPLLISLSSPEQEGRCSPLVILYLNAPARWPECESLTEEDSLLELTVMRPPLSPPPSFLTLLWAATLKYLLHHWQALTLPQCQRFSTQEVPGTLRRMFSCCFIQTLLNNCLDPS